MAPPRLWAELKRRSVVKVGAAHAAAAFVALQLAEIVPAGAGHARLDAHTGGRAGAGGFPPPRC